MGEFKKMTRQMPVLLTDQEKLASADQLGKETMEYQEALDRKSEISKQLSAEVDSHRAAIQRIGALLAAGYEYRPVEVEIYIDRDNDKVTVTRLDTGEVTEDRPLRPGEFQGELPLD